VTPVFHINAGKYRHIVTFQKRTEGRNSYGEPTEWEDAFTCRVGIFPLSGREFLAQETKQGEITHKVMMRYMNGISAETMRILFNERIFDIVAPPINFQERNLELQLLCKERKNLTETKG
jgi:SPP1 family predicted phage head-tail adaptor